MNDLGKICAPAIAYVTDVPANLCDASHAIKVCGALPCRSHCRLEASPVVSFRRLSVDRIFPIESGYKTSCQLMDIEVKSWLVL
ncbi:hypothetical protein CEXT_113171 [Caerostris extrusa]|uniref:Uncharacterized protein n=1 Tax=Caerostris extrusa TaxID=172846 RepID=A0AAV4XRZ9_CAEEX|nr:hypothetical protein CEXT_113171 [Caerostris extrusa]